MFVGKMYKLEKLVELFKSNNNLINEEIVINICSLPENNISSVKEFEYIKGAVAIPYHEMIGHIDYYRNNITDEASDLWFVEELSKKYCLSPDLVVKRFHNVERLSKSHYSKKMDILSTTSNKKILKNSERNC